MIDPDLAECAITIYPYGILVKGWFDIRLFDGMTKMTKELKYDICDGKISEKFGGALCFTNKEKSKLWRKHLGISDE